MDNYYNQDVTWLIGGSPTQMKILDLLNNLKQETIRDAMMHRHLRSAAIKWHHDDSEFLIPPAPTRIQDVLSFRSACMRAALQILRLSTFHHLKSNIYSRIKASNGSRKG